MSTLLMTGILFAFAGFGALSMRRRFEEQLPLAVSLVVIVLYVFGLFNALHAGVYAVLLLAAAALTGQVVLLIRGRMKQFCKQLFTPGTMAFFLIALWLLVSFRGYMFSSWDEFSHWGTAVKNMAIFEALPSAVEEATITYVDYPPATTLFSWMWTHLSGAFNEEDCQRALNMMIMCFLLPAMKEQEWKRPGRALCMSSVLFMLPMIFEVSVFRTLQVDVLLGCMMLYALYAWFLSEKLSSGIALTLFLLPLVKASGAALGAAALVVIAVDILWGKHRRKEIRVVVLLTIALLLGKLSWDLFLRIHQVGEFWGQKAINVGSVIRALAGMGTAQQKSIMGLFVEKMGISGMWGTAGMVQLSLVTWMLLVAVGQHLTLAGLENGAERRRFLRTYRILFVGMMLYLVALMLMYVFVFRPDEAIYLGSIHRYLASYMIPIVGFTVLNVIQRLDQKCLPVGLPASLCMLLCITLLVSPEAVVKETITSATRIREVYEDRMNDLISADAIELLDERTDRVYLVASGDNGWQYYKGAYQLTPVKVQDGMWTTWPVVEKTADWSEISAVQYSPEEWAQVLAEGGFTYVYLDTIDERFIRDYHTLFASEIRDGRLYRVEKSSMGVTMYEAE